MSFYLSWDAGRHRHKQKKDSSEEHFPTTTTTAYIETTTTSDLSLSIITSTKIEQTIENLTTYIQRITYHTHSSMHNIPSRNNILISLIIFLIFISLCISVSYCIFIYFSYYLNTKSIIARNKIVLERTSFISSQDSNPDTPLNTFKMETNTSSRIIDKEKEPRHSSIDSIKLFRY